MPGRPQFAAGSEYDLANQGASKTQAPGNYEFVDRELGVRWVFVDTPGILDTSGVDRDSSHLEAILKHVEELPSLHAVLLVVNGRSPKLTQASVYARERLKQVLPDVVLSNLAVVVSNAATPNSCIYPLESLDPVPKPEHTFFFENSLFAADPSTWTEYDKQFKRLEWDASKAQLHRLRVALSGFGDRSVAVFQEMREARHRIKVELANVTEEFNDLQKVIDDLEEHGTKLANAKDRAEAYQNFTTKTLMKRKRLVDGAPKGCGPDAKSTI